MAKDNSRILSMVERGYTSREIRKATRAPIMRIAGIRAAHTRAKVRRASTKLSTSNKISLKLGTDAHRLIVALLKQDVELSVLAKASGYSKETIGAIKAHVTMGTYK